VEFLAGIYRGRSFVFRRRTLDLFKLDSRPRQYRPLRILVFDGVNFLWVDKHPICRPST
jgi:hypothetical protein